jgi:hypothetical protein
MGFIFGGIMLEQPMCCPNEKHAEDPDFNAGMDIIPEPDKPNHWFCCDCRKVFKFEKGISTLLK